MNIPFQEHGDTKLFLHYNVIHKSVLLLNFFPPIAQKYFLGIYPKIPENFLAFCPIDMDLIPIPHFSYEGINFLPNRKLNYLNLSNKVQSFGDNERLVQSRQTRSCRLQQTLKSNGMIHYLEIINNKSSESKFLNA